MIDYINKLEILKEYLFLKIDWDCEYPLMSFETYQQYRMDEPDISHWMHILNAGVKAEHKRAKQTLEVFDQTGLLLANTNHREWMGQQMAAMSADEIRKNYYNRGIVASKNGSLFGAIGAPLNIFGTVFNLS